MFFCRRVRPAHSHARLPNRGVTLDFVAAKSLLHVDNPPSLMPSALAAVAAAFPRRSAYSALVCRLWPSLLYDLANSLSVSSVDSPLLPYVHCHNVSDARRQHRHFTALLLRYAAVVVVRATGAAATILAVGVKPFFWSAVGRKAYMFVSLLILADGLLV